MNFIIPLSSLFEMLNSHGIHYCIIRDFESVDQVNSSQDIDVVVKESERNLVRDILIELGWRTQRVNRSLYGHEQYYKWNESKLVELDIVWGVFFSDGEYELSDQDLVYENVEKLDIANIPRTRVAIMLLVLHLLFDKNKVSEKNYNQLKRLYSIANNQRGLIYEVAHSIIEKKGFDPKSAQLYKQQIIKTGIIKSRVSFYIKPKRILKVFVNAIKKRAHLGLFFYTKNNPIKVAVMGVDGAGKSSTIQKLNEYYKGSYVQYMGFREDSWESSLAKRWACFETSNGLYHKILGFVKNHVSIIYEGYYRYRKAINMDTKIVFFDRYYSERYNNSKGVGKVIIFVFLKLLYPKPDLVFYLHCSVEESLRRKDDIDDIDEFVDTKNRWDNIYLFRKNVVSIDTGILDENDVLGIIIEHIATL